MGSYILSNLGGEDLDMQSFKTIFEDSIMPFFQRHLFPVVEEVRLEYFPVWSSNKERIFLSARVVPKRRIRYIAGIACIIGLILAELFTILVLPSLIKTAANWIGSALYFVIVVCALLLALAVFGPTIIFIRFDALLDRQEMYLKALLKVQGIDVSPLTSTTHWILFPGDKYVIAAGTYILYLLQTLVWLQALEIFRPFLPLLLITLAWLIVLFIHSLAYKAIHDEAHLPYFWKLKVTGSAMTTVLAFTLPILLFAASYISVFIGLSASNLGVGAFSFHKLFNFDLSYPNGLVPDASFFSYYYTLSPSQFNFWNSFQYRFFQLSFFMEWLASPVLLLFSVLATVLFNINLRDRDLHPTSNKQIARKSSKNLIDVAIWLEWLIITGIKFIGVGLGAVGFLTIFNLPFMEGKPESLLLPYVWFEASLQVALGVSIGTIVARIVLTLIFLPMVLWLLLWFSSLCYKCFKSFYYLCSRKKNTSAVQKTARELSRKLHVPAPIISIENTEAVFPVTTVLFPKHCVIHISPALIGVLKQDSPDLELMLAHELGHVVKHSTKLWWTQIVSCLSLNGVGYLTLLIDYWRMETEADEYSLHVTKDHRGIISLLERLNDIEAEVTGKMLERTKPAEQKATAFYRRFKENKLIGQVTKAYNLYFASNLWGGTHPYTQERIDNLRIFTRLSAGALRVIEYAKDEVKREYAKGLPSISIESEHLLLGLLHECNPLNVSIEQVRSANENAVKQALEDNPDFSRIPPTSQIDFESETRQILVHAANIADDLNHDTIDPEHLWIGLLHERDAWAIDLLKSLQVDLKMVHITIHLKLAQRKAGMEGDLKPPSPSHPG